MHVMLEIIYIQLPCGPSPPPCRLRSAFCVLCCGGETTTQSHAKMHKEISKKLTNNCSKNYQKSSKNRSKIVQKSIKNRQKSLKIEVWRGPEGSWGPQGCPKGARNQKSDEKFAQPSFVPPFPGSPKSSIFDFSRFLSTFLWSFFGGAFWRPPTTNFRGFWGVFLIVFWRFLWSVVRRVAMQKTSFCIGIYSVWWPSTFLQKAKKTKKCHQNERYFSRGLSTPLFHRF